MAPSDSLCRSGFLSPAVATGHGRRDATFVQTARPSLRCKTDVTLMVSLTLSAASRVVLQAAGPETGSLFVSRTCSWTARERSAPRFESDVGRLGLAMDRSAGSQDRAARPCKLGPDRLLESTSLRIFDMGWRLAPEPGTASPPHRSQATRKRFRHRKQGNS